MHFMYSQSESLCNKKLGFVSLAQNFVSCLVSCVAPFHFLLLSWLETALLARFSSLFSFLIFCLLLRYFSRPYSIVSLPSISLFFYSGVYPFLASVQTLYVSAEVQSPVPHPPDQTRDCQTLLFISNTALTCSLTQNTGLQWVLHSGESSSIVGDVLLGKVMWFSVAFSRGEF